MFHDALQNSHQKFPRDFSSKGVKENFRMLSKNERGKDSDIPRLRFCVSLGDGCCNCMAVYENVEGKLSAGLTVRMNKKPGTSQHTVVLR